RAPKWRHDGQELFYVSQSDDKLMAISIDARTKRGVGPPVALFDISGIRATAGSVTRRTSRPADYAVAKDGQRFIIQRTLNDQGVDPATVVVNWNPSK